MDLVKETKNRSLMDIKDMKLSDTVAMMNSSDYRERFRAEYFQLLIRHHKLLDMCQKWDSGKLDFKPTCSREIYSEQLMLMSNLLNLMKKRAQTEGIDIDLSNIELPSELSPSADSEKLVSLSPEAQKLADAADTLECVKERLDELYDFCPQTYTICNNSFVRGMADLMENKISDAISIIRENKAWQEHRDYLVELNN